MELFNRIITGFVLSLFPAILLSVITYISYRLNIKKGIPTKNITLLVFIITMVSITIVGFILGDKLSSRFADYMGAGFAVAAILCLIPYIFYRIKIRQKLSCKNYTYISFIISWIVVTIIGFLFGQEPVDTIQGFGGLLVIIMLIILVFTRSK